MNTDPRVDAYIDRQADFARPILRHIREVVHAACPQCEEGIKWSMPAFLYKKRILAHMAAFKAHAVFGFWQGRLVVDTGDEPATGMGQFGRLTGIGDLPPRPQLEALVRKAMKLADAGVKASRDKHPKEPLRVPRDLRAALDAEATAAAVFDSFPPSAQRDYVDWINEAKRDETRSKRLAQAIEWIAEGKRRNWKYEKC